MGTELSDSSRTQAVTALEDASALMRSVVRPVTWVTDGVLDDDRPDILKTICCKVARRSLENPLGVEERDERIGDYGDRIRYANASTDVYLTKSERADVRAAAGLSTIEGLSSVRVVAPAEAAGSRHFSAWWENDQMSESDG